MKKRLMVSLGAAVVGLLLSGAPVTAQNQGNGPEAVNFCKALVTVCANPNALGSCVSTGNVCLNAAKTGNENLAALCCEKCFAAAAGCEADPVICAVLFGCLP
jgi:hypothetical protein